MMTTTENTMPCYCTNDTPCRPCVDAAHDAADREAFNTAVAALRVEDDADTERRSFEDASADFYIPGWTPEEIDSREHDRKILADMVEEAHGNPDMAHALHTLYGEDVYSHADYLRDLKADVKGEDL
jgi:hypothetical protein